MTENSPQPVVMTIDCKKPRLRIHKSTIHQMGDPKYIQLMINPEGRRIALRGVDRHIPGQHEFRVDRQVANTEDCVDWYSTHLLLQLRSAFQDIKEGNSYNLTGTLVLRERAVFFDLSSLTLSEPSMGELYARLAERFNHR